MFPEAFKRAVQQGRSEIREATNKNLSQAASSAWWKTIRSMILDFSRLRTTPSRKMASKEEPAFFSKECHDGTNRQSPH